jgi:hypothetical protein
LSPVWNLPFAALAALAVWCRLAAPERLLDVAEPALRFFGIGGTTVEQAAADALGIAGVVGLLVVAWSDRLDVAPEWLALAAAVSAVGLGLAGAWLLARAESEPEPEPAARELTMIEVAPDDGGEAGSGGGSGA